jgi:hypothetical protein
MFNKETKIIIKNFTNNEYAHNPEDGEKVAQYIQENYKGKSNLILDFEGIRSINTAFANKIVHCLYKNYDKEILNEYFNLKNYNELIKETIIRVIENYKEVNGNDM